MKSRSSSLICAYCHHPINANQKMKCTIVIDEESDIPNRIFRFNHKYRRVCNKNMSRGSSSA